MGVMAQVAEMDKATLSAEAVQDTGEDVGDLMAQLDALSSR